MLIAALIGIAYTCSNTLRFTSEWLNFIFACVSYLIPLLAIRPVLRLRQKVQIWGMVLLFPLVSLSSCMLVGTVACDRPGSTLEREDHIQTFQFGASTVKFERYENGGAVGVHGYYLEQRRLIVPGLYLVKSIDFFDSAYDATITVEGPLKVRVIAKGNYYSNDYRADRVYTLKPWVYF
jgi:hypothetical protein